MKASKLQSLLRQAGRAERRTTFIASSALASASLAITLLAVIALDAVFGAPAWILWSLDALLIIAVIVALIHITHRLHVHRYDAHRIARRLEQTCDIADSSLLNALDLSLQDDAACSRALRESAVAQGEEIAGRLEPNRIVNRAGLRRALWKFVGTAMIFMLVWVALPEVFQAVLPRLLRPNADLPPFTLMRFDVTIQPGRVLYGKPVSITAAIRGPRQPGQAGVVFVEDDGSRRPLPMMRLAGAERPVAAVANVNADADASPPSPVRSAAGSQFVLYIERAERNRIFHIQTPYGRSKTYTLAVQPVPLFEDVQLTYDYPAYTGWQTGREPLGSPGIRALVGTRVTVTVRSNVALGDCPLGLQFNEPAEKAETNPPHAPIILRPSTVNPQQASGTFTLERSGQFELTLYGADGTPGDQSLRGSVVVIEDGKPQVRIVEPDIRVVVPEGWKVPVKVEITDDIGVSKLVLYRGVNGWGPNPVELKIEKTDVNHGVGEAVFDLFPLGAAAGDVILYHAVGYDTHPPIPNSAESDIHSIEVVSWEDYVNYVRTRYGLEQIEAELADFQNQLEELRAERQALLEKMQQLQERMEAGQPLTTEQQKQLAELEQRMRDYQKQAAELAKQMKDYADQPQVYDFQASLHPMMDELSGKVRNQSAAAKRVSDAIKQSGASPGTMQAMRAFAMNDEPFDPQAESQRKQTAQDMRKVDLAQRIIEQASRIRQVALEQKELARRLAEFRHTEKLSATQQLRAAKMVEEQDALRGELADATEQLRSLCKAENKLLPNMQSQGLALADKVDQLKIQDDQQDTAHLAAAGEGRYAHQAAESAARKLDSLLSDCNNTGQSAADSLDGCLKLPRDSWANSMKQLGEGMIPGLGKSGGSGGGYAGSSARFSVVGPVQMGRGDSLASRGSRGRGESAGHTTNTHLEQLEPPEALSAMRVNERSGSAAPISGVPTQYRAMVEAYFRRLADDSR